jgi:UDP-glucose 4-epimerase
MRIAVIGSSGFIGKNLVRLLNQKDYEIVEIDKTSGIDLLNWEQVNELAPCDVIVHLAAKTFVPDSFNKPGEFYHTNHTLTLHALELARKWKARVIYMSSYFYGPPQYIPVDEKHPLNPHNPYAQSKYMSESLCQAYSRDFDVPVIAFRLFNIYGPGQTGSFLIPEILEKIKQGGTITLKDPRPKRDFIHVNDVVNALCLTMDKGLGKGVIQIGPSVCTSIKEIAETVVAISGKNISIQYDRTKPEGDKARSADYSKAQSILGWEPLVDLRGGLEQQYNWIKERIKDETNNS